MPLNFNNARPGHTCVYSEKGVEGPRGFSCAPQVTRTNLNLKEIGAALKHWQGCAKLNQHRISQEYYITYLLGTQYYHHCQC